jgi:heptosyltransferase III
MTSMIYHAGALGDFITTLPAMAAWRRLHPRERIGLLGKPRFAALAGAPAPFDETLDVESAAYAPLFSADASLPSPLAERLSPVTSALVFAHASSPLVTRLSACGVRRIVRQDPFPGSPIPIVDYHLSLFPSLALDDEDRMPRIACNVSPHAPTMLALHPGSGSPGKNWPVSRFMELAGSLREEGEMVTWIVGPAEETIELPPSAVRMRCPALSELAGRLSRCRLFVGNDSGVAHLAAASGCPTVVLFGASDPVVWAPRGRTVRVIISRGSGMDGIRVDDVLPECLKILGR